MDAVLKDHRDAPLDERHRALFDLIEKVNRASNTVTAEDVRRAKDAGWSDEALYDAITVAALFRFYNAWIDATGVSDMSPEAYAASGHRLATQGYTGDEQ